MDALNNGRNCKVKVERAAEVWGAQSVEFTVKLGYNIEGTNKIILDVHKIGRGDLRRVRADLKSQNTGPCWSLNWSRGLNNKIPVLL